jgi:type I restriction enzyme S subunit
MRSATLGKLALFRIELLPVPLCTFAEQQRIVAEVERRLSVVEGVEAAIAANLTRAGRLRQAILKKAFAGELVPQNPDDEPASALLERIRGEKQGSQQKLPGV